jgi:hypothetical protein
MLMAATFVTVCQAKKVKVTIDGTVMRGQTTLYLIVNEDTAHAQLVPINDGMFSVNVEVDRNAFIRLHDWKEFPENSPFVLIPDSRHITIDWNTGSITGSQQSSELQAICKQIRDAGPNGFHIDVFSDDPEAWREARVREAAMREDMMNQQKKIAKEVMLKNKDKIYGAWIMYTFPELLEGELNAIISYEKPKWASHPILKAK